jgi:hypothetical protein
MTKILVEHDNTDAKWRLYDESGNQVAGPWSEDPRRSSKQHKKEVLRNLTELEMATSDYRYIRESSQTPMPWS